MSAPKLAVIVAAGRGVRLKGMGEQRPKGFIELGGRAIVERSVELLAGPGVQRTLIVTGHLKEWYEALAGRMSNVELAHNPDFASSGSMYTLYLARDRIREDFVLVESDLVYEKRALDVLFAAPSDDTLLTSGATNSGDEVYVQADRGKLTGLSKQRAKLTGTVVGELVGLTRISRRCLAAMCTQAESVFRDSKNLEYEQALVAAAREVPVECRVVDDLVWTEIDDEHHLARARDEIFPRIMAREAAYAC